MLRLLLITLLWTFPCFGALLLKNQFQKAEVGDYLVFLQCKNYTLLMIQDKTDDSITIEEITLPQGRSIGCSWKEWVEKGALGHSNWIKMTLNTNTGAFVHSNQNYSKQDQFFPTLLNLQFSKISQSDRKRVGPRGNVDIPDRRRLWNPPLVFEGKRVEHVSFEAWRTRWPEDRSELSNKIITAYLPEEDSKYPSYFPYWLQVQSGITKTHLQVIDSGRNLNIPRR